MAGLYCQFDTVDVVSTALAVQRHRKIFPSSTRFGRHGTVGVGTFKLSTVALLVASVCEVNRCNIPVFSRVGECKGAISARF